MNFAIAVKGLIRNGNRFLVLKRGNNDVQSPDKWEIPGGRLDSGENPLIGLEREIHEETGLSVTVVAPIDIDHFTRKDNLRITMIIFFCESNSEDVLLSEEHSDFMWVEQEKLKKMIGKHYSPMLAQFEKYLAKVV